MNVLQPLPRTKEAKQLLLDGSIALSHVESAGICVDVPYIHAMREKAQAKVNRIEARLKQQDVWKEMRKAYGTKASLTSHDQLAHVLFEVMGLESHKSTATGKRAAADEENLARTGHPFVAEFLEMHKLIKLESTYFTGILREVCEGVLHPAFSLNTTRTYRSSSSDPNFQNLPIRDPLQGKLIRRAFRPRRGRVLLEIDYSAAEVRLAACYHKDPTMLKYIRDDYDMHKDMAVECFQLPASQVTKAIRHVAKNKFVFPEFYGSWYKVVGEALWAAADGLKTESGQDLKRHLASKGLTDLEQFTNHINKVENRFWDVRFPVYKKWKQRWYQKYQEQGWFEMFTGFVCNGIYKRNDVINYPVQGAAFHCLLWSLIRIVKWLRKYRMQSLVVGQIHDSILLDVAPDEMDDVLAKCKQVMTEDLGDHWPWLIVPMKIEAEASDVNWYEKKGIEI